MQQTNWQNLEIKQSWDNIASIIEEQMIYFGKETQEKIKKEIAKIDKHISTLK